MWGAMFVAVEGKALLDKDRGDTLSEHLWAIFSIRDKSSGWLQRRAVLAGALTWLVAHLLFGWGG